MTRLPRRRSASITHAFHRSRLSAPLAVAALLGAAAPGAHAASIWTPVASGTTDTITTIDHRASVTVFGTSGGKIFRMSGSPLASTPVASFAGASVIDLELSPSGTNGIVVLSGGRVARSTDGGATWGSPIQLKTYSPTENSCIFTPTPTLAPLTQEATSVGWASDSQAYVTDNLKGSLERTFDGGATWTEIGRKTDGSCVYDAVGVKVVPQVGTSSAYLVDDGHNVGFTSNGFAATSTRGYFVGESTFAVDTTNPSKMIGGHNTLSDDGGTNFRGLTVVPEVASIAPTRGTSYVGDTAIWVGDAGDIFTSTDGTVAYRQPADGAGATTAWKAVSAASASDAMVGGDGGALVISSTASTIPPTATPTPTPTPTPVATPVRAPVPTPTAQTTPIPSTAGITPAGKTVTTLTGASLTLQGPTACVKAGASFAATMSMRRITIKNNKIVKLTRVDFFVDGKRVKIDRKAPFKQTLKVPASAAGSLHTLKAVGYIKVIKGKAPKKTQTVKFATCG